MTELDKKLKRIRKKKLKEDSKVNSILIQINKDRLNRALSTNKTVSIYNYINDRVCTYDSGENYKGSINRAYLLTFRELLDKLNKEENRSRLKQDLTELLNIYSEYFNNHNKDELCYMLFWDKLQIPLFSKIWCMLNKNSELYRARVDVPKHNDISIVFIGKTVEDIEKQISKGENPWEDIKYQFDSYTGAPDRLVKVLYLHKDYEFI